MGKIKKEIDLELTDKELSEIYKDVNFNFHPTAKKGVEGFYFFHTGYLDLTVNVKRKNNKRKFEGRFIKVGKDEKVIIVFRETLPDAYIRRLQEFLENGFEYLIINGRECEIITYPEDGIIEMYIEDENNKRKNIKKVLRDTFSKK